MNEYLGHHKEETEVGGHTHTQNRERISIRTMHGNACVSRSLLNFFGL